MFRSVLNSIRFVGIGIAALLSAEPLAAQTAVCSLSDPNYQYCLYHGVGRQLGYEPSSTTELSATANWDQPNDGDLHGLLPQSETYSDPLIALPAFPLQPTQPFYPNATGSHIYPNHYQSQVNGGAAVATHSGDDGGGVATYAGQPGCDPATLTGVSCESIRITGEVPSGLYSFTLHAFPDTGTTFDPTNFDITVRATGNMVLTANSVATATPNSTSEVLIDPDTGVIRQVGTYQGTNNTTSRLDVFALNVGHAGHVGGVTIPQIGSYLDTQGVQRWFPANPQDVDVSLPDQIAMQFQQRDILVDQYQEEARAELQRRYEAEQRRLARLREERLQAQRELEQRELNNIPTQVVTNSTPDNCVSSSAFYTHSYDVFGCNTVQSQQVGQETDVWDFDTFETANTTTTFIIGNEADTSAGTLVDGSHNFEISDFGPNYGDIFINAYTEREYSFSDRIVGAVTDAKDEFTSQTQKSGDEISDSLIVVFDPEQDGLVRLENSFRATYQTSLGVLKAGAYSIAAGVGGLFEPELDAALAVVSAAATEEFENLSPEQQQWIVDNYLIVQQAIEENPELKATVETAGFVSAGQLFKGFKNLKLNRKIDSDGNGNIIEGDHTPNTTNIDGKTCVYTCVIDGKTRYVGITDDIARRGAEHLRSKKIEIEQIAGLDNLSRADAKAVEQTLINYYGLGKDGGTLLNKINSISATKNPTAYEQSLIRGKYLLDSVDYQWANQ